jgi:hypothetical protein
MRTPRGAVISVALLAAGAAAYHLPITPRPVCEASSLRLAVAPCLQFDDDDAFAAEVEVRV